MKTKNKKISIDIDAETVKELRKQARLHDRSLSAQVRVILRESVENAKERQQQ